MMGKMTDENERLRNRNADFLTQIHHQVKQLKFWEEISEDIDRKSEKIEEIAGLILGVCTGAPRTSQDWQG